MHQEVVFTNEIGKAVNVARYWVKSNDISYSSPLEGGGCVQVRGKGGLKPFNCLLPNMVNLVFSAQIEEGCKNRNGHRLTFLRCISEPSMYGLELNMTEMRGQSDLLA